MDCDALAPQVSTLVENGSMLSESALQRAISISHVFVVVPLCELRLRFEQITEMNQWM